MSMSLRASSMPTFAWLSAVTSFTFWFATLAACSTPGPVAQTSTGLANQNAEIPQTKGVIIPQRSAPVPVATDPRERVVFTKAGSIWIMGADGAEATQLTVRSHRAPDESAALSPRGKSLAYSSPTDGKHRIYAMSFEELLPRAITSGEDGGDANPSWSPDGRRIVFARGDPRDKRDVYITVANGSSSPTLLLAGEDDEPDFAGTPVWSPDGKTIVIASDRRQGRGTRLWAVAVPTGDLRPITPVRAGGWFVIDRDPAFSPDGQRIAFASNRHASNADQARDFDIYTVGIDGSGLTRLTEDPGIAGDPSYSPDGKRLYFTSNRLRQNPYETEIFVMAARGGKQRRMTRDERPQNSAPHAGRTE